MKTKKKTNCKRKSIPPNVNRELAGRLNWVKRELNNINSPEKNIALVQRTPPVVINPKEIQPINFKLLLISLIFTLSLFTALTLISDSAFDSFNFSSVWSKLSGHGITGAEISVRPIGIVAGIIEETIINYSLMPGNNNNQNLTLNLTEGAILTTAGIQADLGIQGTATSSTCGTVDASLTLTANIINDSICFTIAANNLVLDGAGYTITGNGSSSYGIRINGYDNVTIKNFGGINNFSTAIGDLDGNTGENNTFFNNTIVTVRDKSFGAGIIGISLGNSVGMNVSSNTIYLFGNNTGIGGSSGAGISLLTTNSSIISANIINTSVQVGGGGIILDTSSNLNNITNNIITVGDQNQNGIYLRREGTSPNLGNRLVANNITCNNNGAKGIYLEGSFNSTLNSNNITINGNNTGGDSAGIELRNSSYNELISNFIVTYGANTPGLTLSNSGGTVPSNNNNLTSNTIIVSGMDAQNLVIQNSINNHIISNNLTSYSNYSGNGAPLSLSGANYTLVSYNSITARNGSTSGLLLFSAYYVNATNNVITTHFLGQNGIHLNREGTAPNLGNRLIGNNITINNNGGKGIYLDNSFNSTVSSNNITINGNSTGGDSAGIELRNSSYNELSSNFIITNGASTPGLTLSNSDGTLPSNNNNLTSNTIIVNGTNSRNLLVQNSINNLVTYNNLTSYSNFTDGDGAALFLNRANYTLVSSNFITVWNSSRISGLSSSTSYYNNFTNNIIIIHVGSKGIYLSSGAPHLGNRLISNNITCNNNGVQGIYLEGFFNGTVSSNNITINGNSTGGDAAGIELRNSSYNEFSSNLIVTYGANTLGLLLSNFNGTIPSNNNNLTSNTIIVTGTSSRNIVVQNSINNRIISNNLTSYSNFTDGDGAVLFLGGSNHTLINSNTITAWNASVSGISLGSRSYNSSSFNNITSNTITTYGGDYSNYGTFGVDITEFSNFARVLFNNITAVNFIGIGIRSGSNVFQNNSISNSAIGYELAAHAIGNNITADRLINNTKSVEINGDSGSKYNNIFRDVQLINNTADFAAFSGPRGNITFINSSVNRSKISVSISTKALVKWYVDVSITDSSGNYLSNAAVAAYNSLNGKVDNTSTNSNGIARLEVAEYYQTNYITFYLTPSTIVAKKANYTHNSTVISLINQTYALVNLSLNAVACGTTLSGSVDLGNNYYCNGDGLIIGADNITINGNGYNLTGDGSGTAVNSNTKKNLTLNNLNVFSFSTGINFYNTNHSNLTKMTLSNNIYGIIFNNSNDNSVYDSMFNNSINDIYAINNSGDPNSLVNYSGNLDNITTSSAAILLKWYVDVNATFNQNLGLPNANASGLYNSTGELEYSVLTDSNGLARLFLTELKKNSSGVFYLTPHNITLAYTSVSGSSVNFTSLNLTKTNNTQVNLSLALNCTAPALSTNVITNSTVICPGTYQTTDLYAFEIGANNITLTCDNTILKASGAEDIGINIVSRSNVTISGCTLKNYFTAIYFSNANNTVINNTNITSDGARPYYLGVGCYYSKNILLNNMLFSNPISSTIQIILSGCNNSQITGNTLTGDSLGVGIQFFDSYHGRVTNNTFNGLDTALRFFINYTSRNNTFYYNNFSGNLINTHSSIANSNYVNFFNTSVNSYPQGNAYSDYCNKGVDNNNDSYADASNSENDNDWPYSGNTSTRVYDAVDSNAGIVDYGPKIQTCPAAEVFLGSSSSSSSSSTSTADSGSAPAVTAESAPTVAPPAADSGSVYSPAEAAQFLSTSSETEFDELGTKIKFTLENTGNKRMLLFPELLQEYDDPFFIITRKTLGFEDSLFNKLSGMSYSEDAIVGRLLKATLKNQEQIILEPGEKKETILELEEGLKIPRQIKIQFTTLGEVVSEKTVEQKAFSGTAIDLDTNNQLMDLYAVIVPVSEELEEYYSGNDNSPTGAAIAALQNSDEYFLEFAVNKESSFFGDLYGPYNIKENQSLVFAQQIKFNPEEYSGINTIATKVYHGSKVIVEDEFEVDFGTNQLLSKLSWLVFLLPLLLLFGSLSGYSYYVHKQKVTSPILTRAITSPQTQKIEPKAALPTIPSIIQQPKFFLTSHSALSPPFKTSVFDNYRIKRVLLVIAVVVLLSALLATIFLILTSSQPIPNIILQLTSFFSSLGMWIVPIIASILLSILIIIALKLKFKK